VPLIQIVRKPVTINEKTLKAILDILPEISAEALTCKESRGLKAEDIMIEVRDLGPYDRNCKDLNIRVYAHDYPGRRGHNLDIIQAKIVGKIGMCIPIEVSWYVWVLLSETAYSSDTVKY
jgi:hypothetical protein